MTEFWAIAVIAFVLSPMAIMFYHWRRGTLWERKQALVNRDPTQPVRTSNGISPYALALMVAVAVWWWMTSSGFSDSDIERLKADITKEFSKRAGLTATEVSLVRESSNKLVGFVRINSASLGEFTKDCMVTRDRGDIMWSCR